MFSQRDKPVLPREYIDTQWLTPVMQPDGVNLKGKKQEIVTFLRDGEEMWTKCTSGFIFHSCMPFSHMLDPQDNPVWLKTSSNTSSCQNKRNTEMNYEITQKNMFIKTYKIYFKYVWIKRFFY